jgi:hypothetical protein
MHTAEKFVENWGEKGGHLQTHCSISLNALEIIDNSNPQLYDHKKNHMSISP